MTPLTPIRAAVEAMGRVVAGFTEPNRDAMAIVADHDEPHRRTALFELVHTQDEETDAKIVNATVLILNTAKLLLDVCEAAERVDSLACDYALAVIDGTQADWLAAHAAEQSEANVAMTEALLLLRSAASA